MLRAGLHAEEASPVYAVTDDDTAWVLRVASDGRQVTVACCMLIDNSCRPIACRCGGPDGPQLHLGEETLHWHHTASCMLAQRKYVHLDQILACKVAEFGAAIPSRAVAKSSIKPVHDAMDVQGQASACIVSR